MIVSVDKNVLLGLAMNNKLTINGPLKGVSSELQLDSIENHLNYRFSLSRPFSNSQPSSE